MTAQAVTVRHFDLSTGRDDDIDSDGTAVLTVFWWQALPLGMITASADEVPFGIGTRRQLIARFAAEQRTARDPQLGAPLAAGSEGVAASRATLDTVLTARDMLGWLEQASKPAAANGETISIVVCTRDRGEALRNCLARLVQQRRPPSEIIVVDNAPDCSARDICAAYAAVRYVHEPRPGLSYARNAGVRASRGEIVAFTDDDVVVDPGWTAEIAAAFARSGADAVTGLVLPLRLETSAQRCFQFDMGGFGSSFVPALFDQRFFAATAPHGAHVWRIGAGANMAFRRGVFGRVGGFDTRLGAGASGCSEDSELWYRLLAAGGTCLYEPRAVVHHDHRADWPGLERQMRAYMRGHVAALVAQNDRFGHRGNIRRIFRQLPAYFVRTAVQTVLNDTPDRRRILRQELLGWTQGLRYLVSLRWRRQRAEPLMIAAPPLAWQSAA